MRTMLTIRLPVQSGNRVIRDGTLARVIQGAMERIRPESAYFYLEDGRRTMRAVFDLPSQQEMVPLLERFMLELDADVHVTPVMTAQELEAGFKALG